MPEQQPEYHLSLALPNGIILGLVGVLVLVTPVFTSMPIHQVVLDVVAGSILAVAGAVLLGSYFMSRA